MGRGGGGGSRGDRGAGGDRGDTGSGVSVGSGSGSRDGGASVGHSGGQVGVGDSPGEGGSIGLGQREGRRGDAPSQDVSALDIMAAAQNLGLSIGEVSLTAAFAPDAVKAASQLDATARRGLAGLSVAGGIATGDLEQTAKRGFASIGIDIGESTSLGDFSQTALGVGQEAFGVSQAIGAGLGIGEAALGIASAPGSTLGFQAGKQIGRLGSTLRGFMSEAQLSAGPSAAERAESGVSAPDGDTTGDIAGTGGAAPLVTDETGTEESLAGGDVQSRSRSSLDIRRRTRPASFLGGPFQIQSRSLTG